MKTSASRVKGLGEVAIRVQDLDAMYKFYAGVIGLEVLRRNERFVFFKIAEGYGGHSQVLALFDASELRFIEAKSPQVAPDTSTLHHIALNVALEDFEKERTRLEGLGLKPQVVEHAWLDVRSMYFSDPEGNLLEFVSYDTRVR